MPGKAGQRRPVTAAVTGKAGQPAVTRALIPLARAALLEAVVPRDLVGLIVQLLALIEKLLHLAELTVSGHIHEVGCNAELLLDQVVRAVDGRLVGRRGRSARSRSSSS